MPERRRSSFDVKRQGRYIGTPFHWNGANWHCVNERLDTPQYGTVLLLVRYQDEEQDAARLVDVTRPWWWTEARGEREQPCRCCRRQRPPGYRLGEPLPRGSDNGRKQISRYGAKTTGEPAHAAEPAGRVPGRQPLGSLEPTIPSRAVV